MIGRWLDTITPEMGERLLTGTLTQYKQRSSWHDGSGCLLQVAYNDQDFVDHDRRMAQPGGFRDARWAEVETAFRLHGVASSLKWTLHPMWVSNQYDSLLFREMCGKQKPGRLAHAIRMRVLRNQLRRALGTKQEAVAA